MRRASSGSRSSINSVEFLNVGKQRRHRLALPLGNFVNRSRRVERALRMILTRHRRPEQRKEGETAAVTPMRAAAPPTWA
jgi:hypothetical protein